MISNKVKNELAIVVDNFYKTLDDKVIKSCYKHLFDSLKLHLNSLQPLNFDDESYDDFRTSLHLIDNLINHQSSHIEHIYIENEMVFGFLYGVIDTLLEDNDDSSSD